MKRTLLAIPGVLFLWHGSVTLAGIAIPDTGDETQNALRTEGVYQSEPERNGDESIFLRFYRDGTVIDVTSTHTPAQVWAWFSTEGTYTCGGRYDINGSRLAFTVRCPHGKVDYEGTIGPAGLALKGHTQATGYRFEYKYRFVELPAATNAPQAGGPMLMRPEEARRALAELNKKGAVLTVPDAGNVYVGAEQQFCFGVLLPNGARILGESNGAGMTLRFARQPYSPQGMRVVGLLYVEGPVEIGGQPTKPGPYMAVNSVGLLLRSFSFEDAVKLYQLGSLNQLSASVVDGVAYLFNVRGGGKLAITPPAAANRPVVQSRRVSVHRGSRVYR